MFEHRHASRLRGAFAVSFGLAVLACDTPDARAPDSERSAAREQRADDPEIREVLQTLQPQPTLAGHLRFRGPLVHDPKAAAIFLDRLASGDEPAAVRAALAEALPRSGGTFAEEAAGLIRTDPDPTVRATLVETMKRADTEHAVVGLQHGFADPAPIVRAAAARTSGMHEDGVLLRSELVASLADPDVATRVWAARSIGVLRIRGAEPALVDALGHENAELRLHALRAIHRIDPAMAATLPGLATLARDPDARVARLARNLAGNR